MVAINIHINTLTFALSRLVSGPVITQHAALVLLTAGCASPANSNNGKKPSKLLRWRRLIRAAGLARRFLSPFPREKKKKNTTKTARQRGSPVWFISQNVIDSNSLVFQISFFFLKNILIFLNGGALRPTVLYRNGLSLSPVKSFQRPASPALLIKPLNETF